MPPIDAKIRIRREEDRIRQRLGHAHETRIREAHRQVGVFLHKRKDLLDALVEMKGGYEHAGT